MRLGAALRQWSGTIVVHINSLCTPMLPNTKQSWKIFADLYDNQHAVNFSPNFDTKLEISFYSSTL